MAGTAARPEPESEAEPESRPEGMMKCVGIAVCRGRGGRVEKKTAARSRGGEGKPEGRLADWQTDHRRRAERPSEHDEDQWLRGIEIGANPTRSPHLSTGRASSQPRKRAMRCPLPLPLVPVLSIRKAMRVGEALMPLPVRWGERVSARERLKH